jgi:hypothetical protein
VAADGQFGGTDFASHTDGEVSLATPIAVILSPSS